MDQTSIEIIGLIAGIITSAGFLPQLLRGFKTKKLEDVSFFMPIVLTVGMTLWLTYGYLINSLPVIAANIFSIGCCVTLIIMKKKYS